MKEFNYTRLQIVNFVIALVSGYQVLVLRDLAYDIYHIVCAIVFLLAFSLFCFAKYSENIERLGKARTCILLVSIFLLFLGGMNVAYNHWPDNTILNILYYTWLLIGLYLYIRMQWKHS